MRCLVLDGMGVIFAAADDVVELLVPFVRATGGDPAQVEAAYVDASLGIIDADELWVRVGLNAAVEREYLSAHSLLPGAREFLVRANNVGIPVWCLSNDVARWSRHLRESLGIAKLLSGAVISSDVRVRKPDTAIYRHLLDRTGCSPSDLLFVDDRRKNIEAAAELGIPSLHFANGYGYEQLTAAVFGAGLSHQPHSARLR